MVERGTLRAPVDRRRLVDALRPFGESRMLPREAYTSPEVFEWERRHLFDGGWTCVGTSPDLPGPGSQRAERTGAGSTLLVRGRDGAVRAFANASRHRGHELLACGTARDRTLVRCQWTFATGEVDRPDFDPAFAVDFWDVVNRQDWAACESVQRGLGHPAALPGLLSPDEDAVYQFVTLVARAYAGLPITTAPVGSR